MRRIPGSSFSQGVRSSSFGTSQYSPQRLFYSSSHCWIHHHLLCYSWVLILSWSYVVTFVSLHVCYFVLLKLGTPKCLWGKKRKWAGLTPFLLQPFFGDLLVKYLSICHSMGLQRRNALFLLCPLFLERWRGQVGVPCSHVGWDACFFSYVGRNTLCDIGEIIMMSHFHFWRKILNIPLL